MTATPLGYDKLKTLVMAVVTPETSAAAQRDPQTIAFLQQAGLTVDAIRLADAGVRGNGPFAMLEKNNREAVQPVLAWLERRFSGFWGARASYTLGYARGNHAGAPNPTNNYQVLDQKNLDLGNGPLDTDRRHNMTLNGRIDVPWIKGLNVSALLRMMSGRPFSLIDSNTDADRNGILLDPLPSGDYSGVGANSIAVTNDGGRNGAYGPGYVQMDMRGTYRIRMGNGGTRTIDVFAEVFNLLNRANFTNPSGDRRLPNFLVLNGLLAGGFPRQLQLGARFGF